MFEECKGCPEARDKETDCESGVACCLRAREEDDDSFHELKARHCICGAHFCWFCALRLEVNKRFIYCPKCGERYLI